MNTPASASSPIRAGPSHASALDGHCALALMAAACLVWTLVTTLGNGNLDRYGDMLENYAWSQPLRWGTDKHPPLFSWVVGLWFAVWPQADWAYRLLSYVNVAVGLCGVLALGRRLGLGALAPWGALLLLWTIPYTAQAGKFNANTQLLSLWPWAAALLLASWQERGWRGAWFSLWLGLVAAACMLGKYYSGVLLVGFLLPTLASAQGWRWLASPRPYLALVVFALALAPHLAWQAGNDWVTLGYVGDQGGGRVKWSHWLRFALAPLFYWLPAWLAACLGYARAHARDNGQPLSATAARFMLASWRPQGTDDVLFWLAVAPWAISLGFGLAGVVELSTPWAIPIGYAFALLWLRNLDALSPASTARLLALWRRAWWPVLALVLVLGAAITARNASRGDSAYYQPTRAAAVAIVQAWRQRHPGQELGWVGGQWPDNGMLGFYAQPGLLTVPGLPGEGPARRLGLDRWQDANGLLLCPLGPGLQPERAPTDCERGARAWLTAHGLADNAQVLNSRREGWLFPHPRTYSWVVFDVPAAGSRQP